MSTFFTFRDRVQADQDRSIYSASITAMHTVQWQNAVIQQSIVSKRRFPRPRSTIGLIAENSLSRNTVSAEQSHAQLWPTNARRLSGKEWLWSAKRA